MKILILIILFASTLLSQKLWEIQVNPDDLLRDVTEIPNSDLLLFTYNTGKLEIRRSGDGSFVNQLISKPNESGELRISNSGKYYNFQDYNFNSNLQRNDTIEIRNIENNQVFFRFSPNINDLEQNENFSYKRIKNSFLFENNTKIITTVYYLFKEQKGDVGFLIIYNLLTKEYELIENIVLGSDYSVISKSYLSPDDKYLVEVSGIKSIARLFDISEKKYTLNYDEKNGLLPYGKFQSSNQMIFRSSKNILIYSFPDLSILKSIQLPGEYNFNISGYSGLSICENELFMNVYKRIEGMQNKFDNWFVILNLNNLEIKFDSKFIQKSLEYSSVFAVNNCQKIIIDKDFDNRDGIIACYDFQTLNIETQNTNSSYFTMSDSSINFNSQEFIGQTLNIEIFNNAGAKVGTFYNGILNQANYNFQIPELPSGAYYLQCQLPNQNLNFNFVVVK